MSESVPASTTASADDVKDAPVDAQPSSSNHASQDKPNGTSQQTETSNNSTSNDVEMKDDEQTAAATVEDSAEPSSTKKDSSKRKSTGTVKKDNNRRKSQAVLQLSAKPGDYYWTRMKGYPDWPSIICDEEMIPEPLLITRPVTAMRPDGTYREDYAEGGKNAKERTYPVMFLATNEFMWAKNTDLTPLDSETITEPTKKTKSLAEAYDIAKHQYGLDHFKKMLYEHQKELQELEAEQERKEAEKEAKAAKKAEKSAKAVKRKSSGAASDDEPMEDVADSNGVKAPGSSKKRKKAEATEDDDPKPAKKISLKVSKSQNGESDAKPKPKKAKAPKAETPKLSPEELKAQRLKHMMYLRHKLQKGFLTRDQPPKEEEMNQMADFFNNLETQKDIDAAILRETKVHKVLKAIVKLTSIPRDEEFKFKQRSLKLVQDWQPLLAEDAGTSHKHKDSGEKTNGEKEDDEEPPSAKDETEESDKPTASEKPKSEQPETSTSASEEPKPKSEEQQQPSEQTATEVPATS